MRIENGVTVYESFQELKTVTDKKKKKVSEQDKEKFLGTCKICKQPMSYISGTNVVTCKNNSCKGFKHSRKDKEGNTINSYSPVYRVLNEKSFGYAEFLFD